VGEAQQFEARAYGRRGRELAVPIDWSCSGGGTVSRTGLYAPTRPGRHTVTAQVPRTPHKATATVTVAPGIVVRVERVVVTPPVVTLRVGERRQLQATAYDARGRAVTVPLQWKCLGGGSMSVTGEFRAVRAGTWQVVAQAGPRGPQGKGTAVVWDPSAPRVTRVTVTPVLAQADVGKTVAFRAMAYDARGRRLNVPMTWAVTGQGEIDELTGKFRATHPGLVTIVAQVAGQPAKGSAKVTVGGRGQASIAVDKWELSDRLFEVRVRVDVTVRGPRLKEVKLFGIERDGDDDHLDTEPCKDGARVHLSGKYKRGKARHIEVRLYDMAGRVVATERREARQATRDLRPRIDDW